MSKVAVGYGLVYGHAASIVQDIADAAAQLMITNSIRAVNQRQQNFIKTFSGDVFYKNEIEKTKEMLSNTPLFACATKEAGGCFVAGTLIHTKEGLKPIEQIQVGDWVLSKPESGEGEQTYKRVVNTFSFDDKVVRRVRYSVLRNGNWEHERLIATNNHPFWVSGAKEDSITPFGGDVSVGWTSADKLFPGAYVELATGKCAIVTSSRSDRLWKTKQADIAWESHLNSETGHLITTENALGTIVSEGGIINPDFYDDYTFIDRFELGCEDKWLYTTKVYNVEVEDFHTYYVGQLGAWVHH